MVVCSGLVNLFLSIYRTERTEDKTEFPLENKVRKCMFVCVLVPAQSAVGLTTTYNV